MRKETEENEQTQGRIKFAHRHSQAKCQLIQTSYMERMKLFLCLPRNKHFINRAKLVCMGES